MNLKSLYNHIDIAIIGLSGYSQFSKEREKLIKIKDKIGDEIKRKSRLRIFKNSANEKYLAVIPKK